MMSLNLGPDWQKEGENSFVSYGEKTRRKWEVKLEEDIVWLYYYRPVFVKNEGFSPTEKLPPGFKYKMVAKKSVSVHQFTWDVLNEFKFNSYCKSIALPRLTEESSAA